MAEHTPNDTDYEWAEFFFGIGLEKIGYSHAAVDTLTNLVTRKPNPQIVTYSLELLEQTSRSGPFDRDLLVDRGLADQSYDFVEGEIADFVHYYQGEYDWEHGLFQWGDEHFSKIKPDTFYHRKYIFKKALRALYGEGSDEAIDLLKKVILETPDGDPLKDDARKTLARLYYEKGKYAEADFLYQQIEMNIVEQAQNLLERAWAHYRMGNPERAMGLLYSFEAPSYRTSFTPEFFILKSFIYKDVCHYRSAMRVLDQFQGRYGEALDNIYHRHPPQENPAMLLVILTKPKVKRLWRFLNLLEQEQAFCNEMEDGELKRYLEELYSLKREEVEKKFRILVNDEYEKMADSMLRFEEEAHLMEYEIGLDMYQRVQSYHYSEDKPDQNDSETRKGMALYHFQGEFWNDELDDYEVTLVNKCEGAEEWDIFFK
jgi:tetratricopeptide (TPR) repeat protein